MKKKKFLCDWSEVDMSIEEEIEKLAVRIELKEFGVEENDILGSGILWFPDTDNGYSYVFTAAHVIYRVIDSITQGEKKLSIRYLDENKENKEFPINSNDVAIHHNFKKEDNGELNNDIAVIRCKNLDLQRQNYNLKKIEQINRNSNLIFRGFPKVMKGHSFILSGKSLQGKYNQLDGGKKKFDYSIDTEANLNQTDRNNELIGFSGMGVFLQDKYNKLLLGIHSYGGGDDSNFATVVGMSSELIVEICKDKGWDIPSFDSDVEGNMGDCIDYFLDEIENEELCEVMDDLIEGDFSSILQCQFCGNSQECTRKLLPHRCPTFRANLLIILCILKYLNPEVDFMNPTLKNGIESYPIKFICSEGKDVISRLAMKHFIYSIKCDYLKKNVVEDNSIIIWASERDIKGNIICDKEEFKKILVDIKNDIRKSAGFNIKTGIKQPNELSIIHINKIKNYIENGCLDKIKNQLIDNS
ncbi:hypothetical protein FDA77_05720 [Clostridium botulinum]|uniref:hypothetical protein n=2 Tax=Clostridium botulinum TaxID=1491 RepID=UPI0013F9774B|nr:hypothetical protein [Clostridium botulinum]MBY6795624.1 hypothetical protein [Clostridium botulinum]NFI44693.1 hypothetical protein [Clostridium botulinum]NFJ89423.1 hypothetical protein [Clostridium botulinum]HBJ2608877.1 hypothetical protein [Clostridium botulinum]